MGAASVIKRLAAAASAVCVICAAGGVTGTASDDRIELPVIPVKVEPVVLNENGFKYIVLADDTAELTGCFRENADTLIIPAELGGKRVSSIAEKAFAAGNSFDTVVIPVTVERLAANTFFKADIKTVIVPPTVTEMPGNAVYTKAMYEAYLAFMQSLPGGDTGELDLYGEDIIAPVGDALEIKCSVGSAAETAADSIGAKKTLMRGYTAMTGDTDCNGICNNRDLKQLQTYITTGDKSVLTPSFDTDGNGVINNSDIKLLQSSLTGIDVKIY